jgi:hypothetical protein
MGLACGCPDDRQLLGGVSEGFRGMWVLVHGMH